MVKILQLKRNEDWENLQSWYTVKKCEKLNFLKDCGDDVDVWERLEEEFCCEDCLHKFKILDNGVIFDSKECVNIIEN